MSEKEKAEKKHERQGFTKEQIMKSNQYKGVQKDILSIVLEDGKKYTHEQAKKAIDDFGKRKVN